MSDWYIFWYDHNRKPELTERERVVMCAAVRYPGYVLQVPRYRMKESRRGNR